jgi:4-amino-4-deoxy-L-arabinose transferase-like glycosyltransferase
MDPPPDAEPSGRRLWLPIAGLVLIGGIVSFYELGSFRSFGTHEALAIVPAREMIASGNWVIPYSGGLPRLRKPPLSNWVVAASFQLFGETSEWTARAPAAVSALLLAALVGIWAARWYGRTAGLGAALVQLTSAWAITYARTAEVDMLLCLLTTTALFLIAESRVDEPRPRACLRSTAIFALLSLSWMAKFHYGPAMVLAPCVLFFLVEKRYRSFLHLVNPFGLAIAAAAIFIWPYLVLQQLPTAWAVWKTETIGRAIGDMNEQPVWFYLPCILWLTLPWTGFIFAAVPASLRKAWREGDSRERFLWIWAAANLAIVTLSADKHKHYLNAMLPMGSLLAGQTFVRFRAWIVQSRPALPRRSAAVGTVAVVVAAGTAAVVIGRKLPLMADAALFVGAALALGTIAALWLAAGRRPAAAGYAAIGTFLVAYAGVMGGIMPARDHRAQSVDFARQVRRELAAGREVVAFHLGERDPLVFYLDEPVSRLESAADVDRRLRKDGRLLVVTYEPFVTDLKDLPGLREIRRLTDDPQQPDFKYAPLVVLELTRPAVAARSVAP